MHVAFVAHMFNNPALALVMIALSGCGAAVGSAADGGSGNVAGSGGDAGGGSGEAAGSGGAAGAGGVPESCFPKPGDWTSMTEQDAPIGASLLYWTGTRFLALGGLYDPCSDSWVDMVSPGQFNAAFLPGHGSGSTRFITGLAGGRLLAWRPAGAGALFDPQRNLWTDVGAGPLPPESGTSNERYGFLADGVHVAFWMTNWDYSFDLSQSAMVDVSTGAWETLPSFGAPEARSGAVVRWVGERLVVWSGDRGGYYSDDLIDGGAVFNPSTRTWSPMTAAGAPSPRQAADSVVGDGKLYVWGGVTEDGEFPTDGGVYDPANDTWRALPLDGAPSSRANAVTVWVAGKLLVWGGTEPSGRLPLATGALYDPETDTWTTMNSDDAPMPPEGYGLEIAVPSETGALVVVDRLGRGAAFDLADAHWHPLRSQGGGPPVDGLTDLRAVWDGTHLIVWRGWETIPPDYSHCDTPACDPKPTTIAMAKGWLYTPSW